MVDQPLLCMCVCACTRDKETDYITFIQSANVFIQRKPEYQTKAELNGSVVSLWSLLDFTK